MEAQANLSLHWAHMSESTFSHIAALFYSIQIHVMVVRRTLMVIHLIAGDTGDVKMDALYPDVVLPVSRMVPMVRVS